MNEVTEGQAVIVTDRRHYLSYEEGRVVRATPDKFNRVRVIFPNADRSGAQRPGQEWHAVELDVLGAMPSPGERYEWADRNNTSRVPFTVGERFARGHMYAGLFRIMSDDATDAERANGHTSIASAAEIAKFADRISTPAPDGAAPTLDTLREAVVSAALNWQEDDRRGKDIRIARRRRTELANAVKAYREASSS